MKLTRTCAAISSWYWQENRIEFCNVALRIVAGRSAVLGDLADSWQVAADDG
jgi:hypothetical protein